MNITFALFLVIFVKALAELEIISYSSFFNNFLLAIKLTTFCISDLPNRVKSFYTGGNVLEYFRIPARNALQVTWAHRVVKKADLNETLNSEFTLK